MKKRNVTAALAVLLVFVLLSGCGTVKSSVSGYRASAGDDPVPEPMTRAAGEEYEYEVNGAYWAEADRAAEIPLPAEAAPLSGGTAGGVQNPAKLIYTADLNMETQTFDDAVAALTQLTAEVGGYFESSSVSDQGASRWASYTVRVPADQYRAFLDKAGDQCHVLSLQEYTEDVSEQYYDTAGRLDTQRTKLARLQALLEAAESMEDIILLESAISETEENIDRLSGTLRHYDALVDYSTVEIYLEEVKVYEPEPDLTYGSRLGAAFSGGLRDFGEGLGDILVALAYSWLWLLLLAVIVVLILWLTRKRRAERRRERAERKAARETRRDTPAVYSTPSEEKK